MWADSDSAQHLSRKMVVFFPQKCCLVSSSFLVSVSFPLKNSQQITFNWGLSLTRTPLGTTEWIRREPATSAAFSSIIWPIAIERQANLRTFFFCLPGGCLVSVLYLVPIINVASQDFCVCSNKKFRAGNSYGSSESNVCCYWVIKFPKEELNLLTSKDTLV